MSENELNKQEGWLSDSFPNTIVSINIDRYKQIQASAYQAVGNFPIIDQGQKLIAGWTNDETTVIKDDLPMIVFGDHTRTFKYIDFPFAVGADGTKLIKPSSKFNPRYFYYQLLYLDIPSKGYSRHYKYLKEQIISYPSLSKQQKIAAVLFKIQKAIEVQEAIIERTQELKKATMHQVFTHGLRGEKTKETEIGRIPESWIVKLADRILKLSSGRTRPQVVGKKQSEVSPYPVYGGNGILGYSNQYFISDSVLVLGRVGEYCGAVHIASGKTWISDNALYSKEWLDSDVLLEYLAAYLRFFDLNKLKRRSSQPLITQGIVHQLKLPIPDKDEQKKIARIFQTIDQKIELHRAKKSSLQDLFKTMLNKLVTGEIRVKDLDIDTSEVETRTIER